MDGKGEILSTISGHRCVFVMNTNRTSKTIKELDQFGADPKMVEIFKMNLGIGFGISH